MRLNNRSARLIMNGWLVKHEHLAISGDQSYTEFATELRRFLAPKQVQAPFVCRVEAVRYVREMAHQRHADIYPREDAA